MCVQELLALQSRAVLQLAVAGALLRYGGIESLVGSVCVITHSSFLIQDQPWCFFQTPIYTVQSITQTASGVKVRSVCVS